MSLRQTPRQSDREVRLLDAHPLHPHLAPPPPHGQARPPHLNGGPPIPSPSALTPATLVPHPSHLVSPPVGPAGALNGVASNSTLGKLAAANEETWLLIGRVAEQMGDLEHALSAYENALRHKPNSLPGLTQVAGIARIREDYPKAIEYFERAVNIQADNGEVWSALGHCYLMQDELQKAYSAYQQALYLLPNPKEDPRLWYGIGILYDRYGSLDHAEEAFSSVLRMDKSVFTPDFDKATEILFRLGIIYKQQGKYNASLECFDRILRNPPSPLAHADIWFQIGHVYEQQKDLSRAKEAYERVVEENPSHSKVLQQLGWIYHQEGPFQNQEIAINCLTKSLEADPGDAQSWYLLGRAYMAGQKYNKAYEAYQQAVYRDGRNPTFWCSIGVLYFQINQYRDALDAYSRAIRINPYISEVWFDLGSLYESCNNQISDAIDAYTRAAELDPQNTVITQRLQLLKNAQATGTALPAAPGPQDVHPTAYAMIQPSGPPVHFSTAAGAPRFNGERGPAPDQLTLPPAQPHANGHVSSPPFGGRAPPPLILDDARANPGHTPLAPMEVDRPPMGGRPFPPPSREGSSRGPGGPGGVLLHHPVSQSQFEPDAHRNGHASPHDPYANRNGGPLRRMSPSMSPPHPAHASRPRSPPGPPFSYGNRGPIGPGQPNGAPALLRSPRYGYERPGEREQPWERRGPPRETWERGREPDRNDSRQMRHSADFTSHGPPSSHGYPSRAPSPPPPQSRTRTPRDRREVSPPSPRVPNGRGYWDPKASGGPLGPSAMVRPASPPRPPVDVPSRRYDPRFDAGGPGYDERVERNGRGMFAGPPESTRKMPPPPQMAIARSVSPSGSSVATEPKSSRRRGGKDKEGEEGAKKERKRRAPAKRVKEEPPRAESFSSSTSAPAITQSAATKHGRTTPGPGSSVGSHSSRPSPTSGPGMQAPVRNIDEDYDEGVAETLMSLSTNATNGPTSTSPRVHRGSMSSTLSHASPPPMTANSLKRPLSPHSDEADDAKRTRVDGPPLRRRSSSAERRAAVPSSRPSPIPFRHQPSQPPSQGGSPEIPRPSMDHTPRTYSTSPRLPAVLPPHPRPIGTGTSHGAPPPPPPPPPPAPMALPPIATLPQSPPSSGTSPAPADERARGDESRRSPPVSARGPKLADMIHPSATPTPSVGLNGAGKATGSPTVLNGERRALEST